MPVPLYLLNLLALPLTWRHTGNVPIFGQGKSEGCPLSRNPLGEDGPAVPGDRSPHTGEAHAGPSELSVTVEPLKHSEQPVLIQRIKADAVFTHEDPSLL